jgi:hypothetical protein
VGCFKTISIWRSVFLGAALLILVTPNLRADGVYQRTEDGKSIVWNNNPQPGDAASWKGDRDDHGYATGYGTLTWYHLERKTVTGSNIPAIKRTVIASFSGNAVEGKLTGQVNTVNEDRKMLHAKFVNGRRTGSWTEGPAETSEKTEEPQPDKHPAAEVASSEPVRAVEEIPSEGPTNPPADQPRKEPTVDTRPAVETPTAAKVNAPIVAQSPTQIEKETVAEKSEEEVDDSLRSLIGPPSSIRVNAVPKAPAAPSPPPPILPEVAALSTVEVIGLADAEARNQGYDLGEYELPKVSAYDSKADTWSITYQQKGKGNGKRFVVTVEDKSRKAIVSK